MPMHLYGDASSALLFILALEWISAALLAFADGGSRTLNSYVLRPDSRPMWSSISLLLLDVLPVTLITLSLVMTAGALDVGKRDV